MEPQSAILNELSRKLIFWPIDGITEIKQEAKQCPVIINLGTLTKEQVA